MAFPKLARLSARITTVNTFMRPAHHGVAILGLDGAVRRAAETL
jgi:hypothetical protein